MKAGIAVEALTVSLGAFRLDHLSFALIGGEILVLLGPNGSGKSVTLETIAGFHRPDHGRVLIGGRDVTALPPERRRVGFVVQNFGLFPHLDVADNVAIGRRAHGAGAAAEGTPPPREPAALLDYFGVAHLARRLPAELSPGEKQRVALARALAGAPDVFLFDEPFSALDSQTRDALRDELLEFLRALSIPAIFVTHDHDDALALADRIVVLREGAMVQEGAPVDIFRRPLNSFVARFVGVENILDGRIRDSSEAMLSEARSSEIRSSEAMATVAVGGQVLRVPAQNTAAGQAVRLAIRAEEVVLAGSPAMPAPAGNRLEGRVTGLHPLGALIAVAIDVGFPLRAYLLGPQARAMDLTVGTAVVATIAPERIHVMAD